MKLKELIERSIKRYPRMYLSRTDVLEHLFVVNGNGYEWVGGELVDACEDLYPEGYIPGDVQLKEMRKSMQLLMDKIVLALTKDGKPLPKNIQRMMAKDKAEKEVKFNWRKTAERTVPMRNNPYPLCEYAKLVTLPPDIKPDYKAAAAEVTRMILSSKHRTSAMRFNKDYVKRYPELLKLAKEA